MAGFFSITNNTNNPPKNNNNNNNQQEEGSSNWYLYRGQAHDVHHHHHHQPDGDNYGMWPQPQQQTLYHPAPAVGLGVGVRVTDGGEETARSDEEFNRMMMIRRMSNTSVGGSGSSSSGTISCQDCGNQAKKDCVHMRCRTCCKSRGYDCATHVKSTWVPASVRRHRHHHHTLLADAQQRVEEGERERDGQLGHTKRRRETNLASPSTTQLPNIVTTTATTTTTTAAATTTAFAGMELGNFPAEVSSPAVFRCVRVSSIDDTEDEVAYQTAVSIGGHVFKGILYDQGPDHQHQQLHHHGSSGSYVGGGGGESSSGGGPPLNITAGAVTSTTGIAVSSSPAMGYLDPSLYPLPLSSYMPSGTQFFPNPRP